MSGRAKSVKRFERSNGLDTALYKNYNYLFFIINYRHLSETISVSQFGIFIFHNVYQNIEARRGCIRLHEQP